MKAVLQRVKGACVHVDGKLVSSIGPGIVALIGISTEDTMEDIVPLTSKILSLKLWNENQKASHITVPSQYIFDDNAVPTTSPSSTTPTPTSQPTSRAESVWQGKPWKSSVLDLEGEILCVSQFTLHAKTSKGAKPDFHKSMSGSDARVIYDALLQRLREQGFKGDASRVKDGAFGEMMDLSLTNDGPVTILLDTREKK